MRQKFVQRRIEQADGDRQARHHTENPFEIGALFGEQFGERRRPPGAVFGQDHPPHAGDAAGFKKHVLGAAQPDAFGAETARGAAIGRRFGVGAHLQPAVLVGPFHQQPEITRQIRLDGGDFAVHHFAAGAIQGDAFAFMDDAVADAHGAAGHFDADAAGARHTGAAHAARHHRRMAGHAATRCQDALGGVHAVNIFGAGFGAHKDHRLAQFGAGFGHIAVEHHGARCRTG